jgi:Cyclic nucleotide-binding domain
MPVLGVTSGGHTGRVPASADERLAGLSRSYLFEGLTLEELRPLAAVATTRELVRGEYVWHAGDHAAELYVVLRGEVQDFVLDADGRQVVHTVPGQGQERVDRTSWYPSGSARVTPQWSQYGLRAATRTPPASTKRPTSSASTSPPR